MATKKKNTETTTPAGMSLADKLALLDRIAEDANTSAGRVVMGRVGASDAMKERLRIKWIETPNFAFNKAVGGGLPRGRLTYISGNPDSGKSVFCAEVIGYQQQQDPDFVAVWVETEESLTNDIIEMCGIDPQRFFVIEFTKDTAMEKVSDQLYGILTSMPVDMIVINSMKHLVPQSELNTDMSGSAGVAVAARANARMARRLSPVVSERDTAFVIITHTHTDIAAYGAPQTISGGRGLRYWSSLTLFFSKVSIGASDPITKDQGIKIAVTVRKNHCIPAQNVYVRFEYYALFGQGTEQVLPLIPELESQGIIRRGGATIYVLDPEGKELGKYPGKSAFRDAMLANPVLWRSLTDRLNTCGNITQLSEEEIAEIEAEKE